MPSDCGCAEPPAELESAAARPFLLLLPSDLITAQTRDEDLFLHCSNNVMIRNALRLSRDQKAERFIELSAMDNTGEPVSEGGFEFLEGIEMVPGTVHLVDSEFARPKQLHRSSLRRRTRSEDLFADSPQCKEPPASNTESEQMQTSCWSLNPRTIPMTLSIGVPYGRNTISGC